MNSGEIAQSVLDALGGRENVLSNAVCMTRLRVTLNDPQTVDYDMLGDVQGVLGTALRGHNGLEVVFGPRVIDDIYHAFIALTGISGGVEDLFPMSRQNSNLRVQIRTTKKPQPKVASNEVESFIDDDEMSMLENLFGKRDDESAPVASTTRRLAILNGPNINMLGLFSESNQATDEVYDFPSLLEHCKAIASEEGFARCDCFQSNHEGDLVDFVQDAPLAYDALVLAPGAHGASPALCDALRAVQIPAIEVHLHKLEEQDTVGSACIDVVSGQGVDGYRTAIHEIARHLENA